MGVARPRPVRKRSKLTPRQLENRTAYLFLPPWFVGLVCITIGPILASLDLSFTRIQHPQCRRAGSASTTTRAVRREPAISWDR